MPAVHSGLGEAHQEVQRVRDYAEAILRTSTVPLVVLESNLRVATANEAFYQKFHVTPAATEGRRIYELGNRQWDIPKLRHLLEDILPRQNSLDSYEVTHDFEHIGTKTMLLNARRLEVEPHGQECIVLALEDITARKQSEQRLRDRLSWLEGQREALEAAANGAPLEVSLGVLVRTAIAAVGQEARAGFYLANNEGTALQHIVGMPPEYAEAVDGFKVGPDSLACGLATATGRRVLTADVRSEPLWQPWLWMAEKFDYRACWSFPVQTGTGKFTGTLAIYWRQPREATQRDQEVASLLTHTAAVIISRHKEAEVRGRAEQALAIRTRQQRAVAALGQFALSEPVLQNVFDEAVRSVADTLGNEYCKVLELLPGGARVLLVSGVGWKQGLVGKATVPTDLDSQAGYTLVTEGPVISRDLRTETRFRGPQLLIDHGVISGMSCIIAGAAGKPWGVLGTHTTKERQFTEDDVNFLLAVANVVSNAIRRSQQEEEVRRSEERFRRLVEGAPFGMYIVDSQFRIAHMNARAQAGAFINVRPVIGRSFEEAMRILWPEDVAQQIIGVFRHTLETGEPYYSKDFVNPRADKQQVEGYEWELQRLTLPHGSFGVICYYYDSSELRLAEKALRESEERFRAMADNIDQLAWICAHPLGDVTWYNKRWLEYTGLSFEQTKGWEWSKVQHPDHLDRVVARVKQSAETGEPWEDTFPLRGKDGQYRWFLSRAVPIRDEQGNIVQWFGTNTDVTEQRAAEEALREAHELLADKAKHLDALVQQRTAKLQNAIGELEAFSYSVAHDLRAPLRAMAGYAGVLLEDTAAKLDREERTYLQRIQRAAARLDRLTQEVLTYSKISRGEIKLEHVDLDKLTHEIVEQYPGLSACRDYIEIRSPLLPVVGHESLLTQALSNLLNNACKFVTLDGTPKVVVWTEAVEGDVRIWVEDNGIGIAPEHRSRVFQMFGRIHPDDKYEGTGIGLAVAKRATERMGGTVGFESESGKGSRFWMQLQQG